MGEENDVGRLRVLSGRSQDEGDDACGPSIMQERGSKVGEAESSEVPVLLMFAGIL